MPPDAYEPFTTTMPARLRAAAVRRATATGRTLAAYLADLVREDLRASGVEPPPPPPPKRRGPKRT